MNKEDIFMNILSIDIGIIHLALIYASVDINYNIQQIKEVHLINLTDYFYCTKKECTLIHNKRISTYMLHLFKEFEQIFEEADKIIIEQQPITGIVSVEQIICFKYPNKTELISPPSMHLFFGINNLEYEDRKIVTTKISLEYLNNFDNFNNASRQHDLGDAMCILIFYLNKLKIKQKKQRIQEEIDNRVKNFKINLDLFNYIDEE